MRVIEHEEAFIRCEGDEFINGPSVAMCPRRDIAGSGDMILTFDRMDRRKSNLATSIYRSSDGGRTWKFQSVFEHKFVYDLHGSSRRDGYGSVFSDDIRGTMLYFGTELYFENNDPDSPSKKRKIYYRISFDNGFTWSDKRQIIQKGISSAGQMYDKTHYMHSVKFGANMATLVIPNLVRTKDLTLTLGVSSQAVDLSWNRIDYFGSGFMRSGAIKAKWNAADLGYNFEFGNWATIEVERSTRGLFEPVLSVVNGERIMMVARGSNAPHSTVEGCKFMLVSVDEGQTWSHPEPLLYDDGSIMYSSSSRARTFVHSDGRLFYIGVINDRNPVGNFPRYPLCIAEIDKYSCRVKRKTVTTIVTKPDDVDDTKTLFPVDFTGHWAYEQSDGRLVVLAPCRPDLSKFGGWLNKYVIEV